MKKNKKIIFLSTFIILIFFIINNAKEIMDVLSYEKRMNSYKGEGIPQKLKWYDSFKGINNMDKKEENTKRSYFN